jgi:hypothetical protein
MDKREKHLNCLKIAEHQFRLACTVNLASSLGIQTLDVPVVWSYGKHQVPYEDFGLRTDQAEFAASQLEMTATFVIAAAIKDAILALFENARSHNDPNVIAAYQISRTIRNAFSHSMTTPIWSIDQDCKDKFYEIKDVICLNTCDLNGQPVDWRHYGGPLAMFRFGRFVRLNLLGDRIDPNREKPPFPKNEIYQQGRMILRKLDSAPEAGIEKY